MGTINVFHRQSDHPPPGETSVVRTALASLRRLDARAPRRMKAVALDELRAALSQIDLTSYPAGILGHRDWAILIMRFAGGLSTIRTRCTHLQ